MQNFAVGAICDSVTVKKLKMSDLKGEPKKSTLPNLLRRASTGVSAASNLLRSSQGAVAKENTPGRRLSEGARADPVRRTAWEAITALQCCLRSAVQEPGTVVIEHEAERFASVRTRFGRSQEFYVQSFTCTELHLVPTADAAGKSEAFFVFTNCGRFCLKSVSEAEARALLRLLAPYEAHVLAHETVLLPAFFGLYEVRMPGHRAPLWLLTQANVLGGRAACEVRFDLKGSTHGRRASARERGKGRASVLKDLDFVEAGCAMVCATREGQATWESWVEVAVRDAAFLSANGCIDYSLLVGLAHCPRDSPEVRTPLSHVHMLEMDPATLGSLAAAATTTPPPRSNDAGAQATALVAYVAIVDVLMEYSWLKRLENLLLDNVLSADISCQPPHKYAARFAAFVARLGGPPDALREAATQQLRASRRPLGVLIGCEFGRKDALEALRDPKTKVLLLGGLALAAALRLRRQHIDVRFLGVAATRALRLFLPRALQ